jgi:hypothetical protein
VTASRFDHELRYNPAPLNSSTDLKQFLDTARSQGVSDETLVALLRGREWPEEDVYRVLADHFENRTGFHIPGYKRSSSAKHAFSIYSVFQRWLLGLLVSLDPLHAHRTLVSRPARSNLLLPRRLLTDGGRSGLRNHRLSRLSLGHAFDPSPNAASSGKACVLR